MLHFFYHLSLLDTFVSDVTLGVEEEEDENADEELDRMVRESMTHSQEREPSNHGAQGSLTEEGDSASNNRMFRQTMAAITKLAENAQAGSTEDQRCMRKVISLLTEKQKRRRDEELEEEEAVLIDESVWIRDDNVTIIDMGIRQKLRNPNSEPSDWWCGEKIQKVTRPIFGQSLYLSHLMPGRVNPLTVRKIHDRSVLVTCKGLSSSNSGVVREKKMVYKLQPTDDENTILMGGRSYVECKTVYDVVESVLNLIAVVHQVRPYSYEGLAILRCLHHVKFFYGCSEDPKTQKNLLEKTVGEILSYNQRRGHECKFPATFKKCLDFAKEVAVTNGVSPDLLMSKVDPYCGRRTTSTHGKSEREKELEKENAELKRQAKAQAPQGYGTPRGGNRANRGGRGGHNRNIGAQDGHGVHDLTKSKLQETCQLFNSGAPCDGSCGLKHKCATILRPGKLCCYIYNPRLGKMALEQGIHGVLNIYTYIILN